VLALMVGGSDPAKLIHKLPIMPQKKALDLCPHQWQADAEDVVDRLGDAGIATVTLQWIR